MNFACELIDLCRGTQEVEAVVSEGTGCGEPLARLKMAIRYQEKKVMNKWLLFTWMYQCLLRIYHWKILLRTLSKDYIFALLSSPYVFLSIYLVENLSYFELFSWKKLSFSNGKKIDHTNIWIGRSYLFDKLRLGNISGLLIFRLAFDRTLTWKL